MSYSTEAIPKVVLQRRWAIRVAKRIDERLKPASIGRLAGALKPVIERGKKEVAYKESISSLVRSACPAAREEKPQRKERLRSTQRWRQRCARKR